MTIAIGILARDGMVVAADAEESTGDYMKGTKGKITCWYMPDGEAGTFRGNCMTSCVIAGAGNSGYVQALTDKLGDAFRLSKSDTPVRPFTDDDSKPSLQREFRETIKRFYKDHIIPFASYPERKRPDVEMLIAVQRSSMSGLFVSEKTVLNSAIPFKAIGWGSTFAELFLQKLWCSMSVDQAEILAAYIVFLAKESVETCGKFTTVVSVRKPKIEGTQMLPTERAGFVDDEEIDVWERQFRKKWWKAERDRIFSLIDEEIATPKKIRPSTSRKSKGRQ
jgi:hypothetical protein